MSVEPESGTPSLGAGARALAARVNANVVRDGLSLERALKESRQPSSRDASLVRALCYGSLRWHHRLQWQADQLLNRPLKAADAELAALLRLGLYQLQWLRVPDHAAVAATVAAAQSLGKANAKGLVNAVLRRFLRERDVLSRRMHDVPEAQTSHPGWILDRVMSDWPDAWPDVVDANNQLPPMWLRVNARRATREEYLAALSAAGIGAEVTNSLPHAVLLDEPQPMQLLPGFSDGLVSVQDAGAQLAAGLLAPEPGQRVLDACAAPGGKAAHILESYPDLGELVALDRDADRLAVVAEQFERLGLEAPLICGDAASPGDWWDGRPFDRILLDAPCTALGVIRRHPDIKLLRRADDIAHLAATQRVFLKSLWPLLAPGGRLLYATCTILKEENQHQIRRFLDETPAARGGEPQPSTRQIMPGEANMDGFYYACVDKTE